MSNVEITPEAADAAADAKRPNIFTKFGRLSFNDKLNVVMAGVAVVCVAGYLIAAVKR